MINRILDWALTWRNTVLALACLVAAVGVWSAFTTPLDAIPDLSDVQVIVFTEYPGQSPQVVEDQVTYPLSTAMLSVPYARVVRGYSFFGYSFIYVLFQDGTDIYWARTRVLEYLSTLSGRLPSGVTPQLGPDATGVGWVFEYALVDKTGQLDLAQLRSLQDWYVRYQLQTVPGVAEVASVGGYVKTYLVEVDPNALRAYNLPLGRLRTAIARSNTDIGGGVVESAETEYMIRGQGYLKGVEDLAQLPVTTDNRGTPVRLGDLAHISVGAGMRRGVAELDGIGEVAGGVVIMRFGQNALDTIRGVRQRLAEVQKSLPPGVEVVVTYDRGDLIERAVANLGHKLLEESLVVTLVCAAFLLHVRSALVAVLTLPVGILMAFVVMRLQGINANIMSLGGIAIAIGAMVDGAVVLIENGHKHLELALRRKGAPLTPEERWQAVGQASREVGPALFFSLSIITVSFLPVFTLQAQEGRLFSPLAFTKTYAMGASALLAITLAPVLMGRFLTGPIRPEAENPVNRWLSAQHVPWLARAMARPRQTLLLALAVLVLTAWPVWRVGSEFMPPLDEGDILYMPATFPGISIGQARQLMQQTDKVLAQFPEVAHVFGKAGRAETATDPAMLSMLETVVKLKPKNQWPDAGKTTQELMQEMDAALQIPGLANTWTMPIKTRIDMLSTGIRSAVGVKINGPDIKELERLALEVEQVVRGVPGTQSVRADRTNQDAYLELDVDRVAAARYGVNMADIQDVMRTAVGGMHITQTVEGLERYPVSLRYPRERRDTPEAISQVLIATPSGGQIPLGLMAQVRLARGPGEIKSEGGRPNAWVAINISTGDVGGYVARARSAVAQQVKLPPGYNLVWSGQFEYMARAKQRLMLVIPATLGIILLLLYLYFRNWYGPLVVMASIPFAMVGAFWLVYVLGYNLSVAVAVGFIALAGVAVEIGVLVLTFIDHEVARRRAQAPTGHLSPEEIRQAVQAGTAERLRPVAMTATAVMVGLLPILWGSGTGSEVMRRIAAPMVGGMVTATLLCLLVLPTLYTLVLQWLETKENAA